MSTSSSPPALHSLLDGLNQAYLKTHFEKEDAFWKDKMGVASRVPGEFEKKEIRFQAFTADTRYLTSLRKELGRGDLSETDRTGLAGWLRFFEAHAMED